MTICSLEQVVHILETILNALGYRGHIEKLTIRPIGSQDLITYEKN